MSSDAMLMLLRANGAHRLAADNWPLILFRSDGMSRCWRSGDKLTRQAFLIAAFGLAAMGQVQAGEAPSKAINVDDSTFHCIRQMTPVRHFYVDNLRGNIAATLAAANDPKG